MKKLLLSTIILASTGCQAIFDEHCDSLFNGSGNNRPYDVITYRFHGFEGDWKLAEQGVPPHVIDTLWQSRGRIIVPRDGSPPRHIPSPPIVVDPIESRTGIHR